MFTKGADTTIIPRSEKKTDLDLETIKSANVFARKGYRTLVFAMREVYETSI